MYNENYRHLRIRHYFEDEFRDYWDGYANTKNHVADTSKELNRLFREITKIYRRPEENYVYYDKKHYPLKIYAKGMHVNEQWQKCTVKCNCAYSKKKHADFLRNYMRQENKTSVTEKPKLFNGQEDEISEEEVQEYLDKTASEKFFRFIISPDHDDVPTSLLVRNLIKKIEDTTGYKLIWYAAEHNDTDHKHAHVLINGIDKNHKDVYFERNYISHTIRTLARQTCTELIGHRTPFEIQVEKERMPYKRYYTPLDQEIEKYETMVSLNEQYGSIVTPHNYLMKQRLITLSELGLCHELKNNQYKLEKGWAEKLKSLTRYNTFIDARNSLKFTKFYNLKQYDKNDGVISGTITKLFYMNFEEAWTNALLIENEKTGRAYYVPLRNEPSDKLLNAKVEFGIGNVGLGKQQLKNNLRVIEWSKDNF